MLLGPHPSPPDLVHVENTFLEVLGGSLPSPGAWILAPTLEFNKGDLKTPRESQKAIC